MNAVQKTRDRAPRVFISYSHDNAKHCDKVFDLAQQLRLDGIDAELDQFHQEKLVHWPRWCEERMRPENSDFVLCVCTEEYKCRIEGRVSADVGKGVFWEGTLIYDALYDEKGNRRCTPILLGEAVESDIPSVLRGYTRFHLRGLSLDDEKSDYSKLYRLVTGQPGLEKPELGKPRVIPSLPVGERQTDFMRLIEEKLEIIGSDTKEILAILKNRNPTPSTPDRPHNLPPWMAPEYFIGRVSELRSLCDGLTAPGGAVSAVVQPHVVRGAGGVGKTRLAIQAAWMLYLQGRYDMAFRLSASSAGELELDLAALSEKSLLDLYKDREAPRELEARRKDVLRTLRKSAGHWLLLLDGADSKEARDAVKELTEELAGGNFIITSWRDDWPRGIAVQVPLEVFSPDEARACLLSRYWKQDPSDRELADFDGVAKELGFLPLALALAAGYMESRRITPGRYLDTWKEKRDALLCYSCETLDYDRSLLTAFELSFSQLDGPAATLLRLLSWLAPQAFPRILVEDSELLKGLPGTAAEGEISTAPGESLAQLKTLSLIQLAEDSIQVHRLISACARAATADDVRRDSLHSAMIWLNGVLPPADFDETGWDLWTRLAPHLDHVLETAPVAFPRGEILARLCSEYGSWLFYQAKPMTAEPLMRRALEIDEQSFGSNHPNVAIRLNNLAQLLYDANRLSEAEPLMRRALEILIEFTLSTGHLHPDLRLVFANYRRILVQMPIPEHQIRERIAEIGKEAGFDDEGFRGILERVFSGRR